MKYVKKPIEMRLQLMAPWEDLIIKIFSRKRRHDSIKTHKQQKYMWDMMNIITQEELKNALSYSPETGEWHWIISRRGPQKNTKEAGFINSKGYKIIKFKNVVWKAHRLAFVYMTGKMPEKFVDHKNGLRNDNRWKNLRECNNGQNIQNSKKRKDNSTGYKGVYFNKGRGKRYISQICINGKRIFLGRFDTAEEAHNAYISAADKYFGEFARLK